MSDHDSDNAPDRGLARLVAEIRRRRVPGVAAAYLVVGWALVEVADTTFPYLGLPDWAVTLVIALVALGLPLALLLAWAFEVTPSGVRRDPGSGGEAATRPPDRRVLATVVVAALVVGGVALWHQADIDVRDHPLHPNTVAVLPFRVSGAAPSLGYLREGMADLMAITLSGQGRPNAVDPRAVLSTWSSVEGRSGPREEAVEEVGRRLGAGRLVLGEVVGRPERLTVSATLVESATGREVARARASGPLDSLPALVDDLTAQLISLESGQERHRLRGLTSASLPAVRAYLAAEQAYRRADYREALAHFRESLERDSTFALAALGMVKAASWLVPVDVTARRQGAEVAWRERERLSERDQAYLMGLLGPEYPAPSSQRQRIEAWERAAQSSPGRPEVWFSLGDAYLHDGALTGTPEWHDRARAAFRRALALDSTWNAPLHHLLDLTFVGGRDLEERVRLADTYLDRDSTGSWSRTVRYQRARAVGDTAAAERALRALLDHPDMRPGVVFMSSTGDEHHLADPRYGVTALARMREQAATTEELRSVETFQHAHALNRGWPDTAAAALSALRRLDPEDHAPLRMALTDALYWDGLRAPAEAAAASLERVAAGAVPTDSAAVAGWRQDLCALGQWRAAEGDSEGARRAARRLRQLRLAADVDSFREAAGFWHDEVCATLLDALAAEADGRREDAAAHTSRLNRLALEGPPVGILLSQVNVALAALFEAQGRIDEAAAAAARRRRGPGGQNYYASFLRQRGRLLARLGETEEAIRTLRGYLVLRGHAAPELRDDLARTRAILSGLTGEG